MRSIDELAKLPYSEMSDDEIGLVIEWKSSVKAQEVAFQKMQEQNAAYNAAMVEIARATASANQIILNEQVQQAIDRLRGESVGQA